MSSQLIAQLEAIDVDPDVKAKVDHRREDRHDRDRRGRHAARRGDHVRRAHRRDRRGRRSVSQPERLGRGKTQVVPRSNVEGPGARRTRSCSEAAATVGDVAAALSALGAKPRDLVAILRALKAAGALRAELEVDVNDRQRSLATSQRPDCRRVPRKTAAKQLEAFFLRQLLAEARPKGGMIDGGFAGDTFSQMLDEAIADKIAGAGGLGMAGDVREAAEQERSDRLGDRGAVAALAARRFSRRAA